MALPARTAVAAAVVGGSAHVALVLALLAQGDYPTVASTLGTTTVAVTGFALAFVVLLVTAHTGLVAPAVGHVAVLAGAVYLERSTPAPAWSRQNGYLVVDGPTHVLSYANTWYVWLALLVFAGVVEFALRRGYGIGDRRLRNLPTVPLSRAAIGWTVAVAAGLVGVATTGLVLRAGIRPPAAAVVVFVVAVAVAAVPLAAVLASGIVLPTVLFAAYVPYALGVEAFVTTDSPVHILLFGPYAIVLAVAWILERALRTRFRGRDGTRFTAPGSE